MAQKVWKRLEETDSGTCRSCHGGGHDTMVLADQDKLARRKHKRAFEESEKTCIDCHKGLTHELPDEPENTQADAGAGERPAGAG
jgi:nitrate/TMAO reductase-like tetraheme cytochrome c subunit